MPACPACESAALTELLDRSGVAYDCCGKCRGLWLDGGELSRLLCKPFPEALLAPKDGGRRCPRCAKPMQRGGFLNPALGVDRCGAATEHRIDRNRQPQRKEFRSGQ